MLLVGSIVRGHSSLVTRAIGSRTRQRSSAKATQNLEQCLLFILFAFSLLIEGPVPRANDILDPWLEFLQPPRHHRPCDDSAGRLQRAWPRGLCVAVCGSRTRCLHPTPKHVVYEGMPSTLAPGASVPRSLWRARLRQRRPCDTAYRWRAPTGAVCGSLPKPSSAVRAGERAARRFSRDPAYLRSLHTVPHASMDSGARLASRMPPKISGTPEARSIVLAAHRVWTVSRWRLPARSDVLSFVRLSTVPAAPNPTSRAQQVRPVLVQKLAGLELAAGHPVRPTSHAHAVNMSLKHDLRRASLTFEYAHRAHGSVFALPGSGTARMTGLGRGVWAAAVTEPGMQICLVVSIINKLRRADVFSTLCPSASVIDLPQICGLRGGGKDKRSFSNTTSPPVREAMRGLVGHWRYIEGGVHTHVARNRRAPRPGRQAAKILAIDFDFRQQGKAEKRTILPTMPQTPRTPRLVEVATYKPDDPNAEQQRALLDEDTRQLLDILEDGAGGQVSHFKGVKVAVAAVAAGAPDAPPQQHEPANAGQNISARKSAPEARHKARAPHRRSYKKRPRTEAADSDYSRRAAPPDEEHGAAAADNATASQRRYVEGIAPTHKPLENECVPLVGGETI
ncbi:hypothetical protein AURDEDRAFT_168944 [Auricularia subglabra TFB-10046 SS5]|nr:hypothetical protein AURDEDRAFT_168944 [Auricularia subglabra TFB-10046 SS5]